MNHYEHFRKYASFLLENHFKEFFDFVITEGERLQIPLLERLKVLPEEQFQEMVQSGLKQFLNDIRENRIVDSIERGLETWKKGFELAAITEYDIQITDINLIYRNRKLALIKLLDKFTSDITLCKKILFEIEDVFSYTLDISYKTYVEIYAKRLREEERFLQLVVNSTEEGILTFDRKGRISLFNSFLEKFDGLSKEGVLGKHVFEVLPIYPDQDPNTVISKVLNGEKVFLTDKVTLSEKQSYEAEITPIYNEHKEIVGGLSIIRDITERKQREEELIRSRNYYLTLFDEFPALIWRTNIRMEYDYFNKTWLRFTGRSFQQEQDQGWTEGVYEEDLQRRLTVGIAAFEKHQRFSIEYRLRKANGEYHWILDTGQPIYDLKGNFSGFLGACYDIHESRESREKLYNMYLDLQEKNEELARAEEALRETNLELEERINQRTEELRKQNLELKKTNTDLDNFIYTASHDLKAPIANIEGLVSALQESQSQKEILKLINDSISRFKNTLFDLTEISRAQREIYSREQVSLEGILEDIIIVLKDQIEKKRAKIDSDFQVHSIFFSKKNFRSILYNLISNALKFTSTDTPPLILIKSYRLPEWIIVSVSDNGLGIKQEHQEKIFQMFKRVHNHVEGTGIGLYIVKRIMENSEGKIEVESKEDRGATFKLYFKP